MSNVETIDTPTVETTAVKTNITTIDAKTLEKLNAKYLADQAKKEEKVKKNIAENYPHALVETAHFQNKKWYCSIKCNECGEIRENVATSDLWQTQRCVKHTEAIKNQKKEEKKADLKAARELLNAQKGITPKVKKPKTTSLYMNTEDRELFVFNNKPFELKTTSSVTNKYNVTLDGLKLSEIYSDDVFLMVNFDKLECVFIKTTPNDTEETFKNKYPEYTIIGYNRAISLKDHSKN